MPVVVELGPLHGIDQICNRLDILFLMRRHFFNTFGIPPNVALGICPIRPIQRHGGNDGSLLWVHERNRPWIGEVLRMTCLMKCD